MVEVLAELLQVFEGEEEAVDVGEAEAPALHVGLELELSEREFNAISASMATSSNISSFGRTLSASLSPELRAVKSCRTLSRNSWFT